MNARLLAGVLLLAACSRQRDTGAGAGLPEGVEPPFDPRVGGTVVQGAPHFATGAAPTFPIELGPAWKQTLGAKNTLELWRIDDSEQLMVTVFQHETSIGCDRVDAAARQILEANRVGTRRASTGDHRYRIDPGFMLDGRYEMFAEGSAEGSKVRFAARASTDTNSTVLVEHYFYGTAPITRAALQRVTPPTAAGARCR